MTSTDDTQSETTGGSSRIVRAEYDWANVAPSMAVTETVADAAGREPTTIAPLYRYVDPDALDQLVRSSAPGVQQGTATVAFEFEEYHVTVTGDGLVVLEPVWAEP